MDCSNGEVRKLSQSIDSVEDKSTMLPRRPVMPDPKKVKALKEPNFARRVLEQTSVTMMSSIPLDMRVKDENLRAKVKSGGALATSDPSGLLLSSPIFRLVSLNNEMRKQIDWAEFPWCTEEELIRRCENTIYAGGGAQFCLRRLQENLPKRKLAEAGRPVNRKEANTAYTAAGNQAMEGVRPRLLEASQESSPLDKFVEVNAKSSSGFPRLTNLESDSAMILADARALRESLQQVKVHQQRTVELAAEKVRAFAKDHPLDFLCRGACKGDPYKLEKVERLEMRFYNVLPRAAVLIMQQATQALEAASVNIISGKGTSSIGIDLSGGGANALVDAIDRHLEEARATLQEKESIKNCCAFTHFGDDTWFVLWTPQGVWVFSLDCTAFDLWQRGKILAEVHASIARQLWKVDKIAGALWLAFVSERLVTISGACVVQMNDAGPSGLPMQTKINDIFMEVVCDRLRKKLVYLEEVTEEVLANAIREVGVDCHLKIRLEQPTFHSEAYGLRDCFKAEGDLKPFMFQYLGYLFYAHDWQAEEIRCMCDMPRMMAQLPFMKEFRRLPKEELEFRIALKLAGLVRSFGMPHRSVKGAFEVLQKAALTSIDSAKKAVDLLDETKGGRYNPEEWIKMTLEGVLVAGSKSSTVDPTLEGLGRSIAWEVLEKHWTEKPVPEEPQAKAKEQPFHFDSWFDEIEVGARKHTDVVCGVEYGATSVSEDVAMGETFGSSALPKEHAVVQKATLSNFGRPPPQTSDADKEKLKEQKKQQSEAVDGRAPARAQKGSMPSESKASRSRKEERRQEKSGAHLIDDNEYEDLDEYVEYFNDNDWGY